MKETLTRIGMIFIVLMGIIGALYQLYELYTLGLPALDESFSELSSNPIILGIAISIFTIIVSIGLLFHNKIARWITLFSSYYGLMFTIVSVSMLYFISFKRPAAEGVSASILLMSLASVSIFVLMIYVLSNQAALKLFGIQRNSNLWEVGLFSVATLLLAALPFVLSLGVMKLLSKDLSQLKLEQPLSPVMKPVKILMPLEVLGRGIYIREGCFNCHTQQVSRYRSYALSDDNDGDTANTEDGESQPFQWGSATRVDIARLSGKYTNSHLLTQLTDPKSLNEQSEQPAYPWLLEEALDVSTIEEQLRSMRKIGTGYSSNSQELEANIKKYGKQLAKQYQIENAQQSIEDQQQENNYDGNPDKLTEMDALIAYLQSLK